MEPATTLKPITDTEVDRLVAERKRRRELTLRVNAEITKDVSFQEPSECNALQLVSLTGGPMLQVLDDCPESFRCQY